MLKLLYLIYQLCIGFPLFLVLTILTALTTILGCTLGNGHFWGYYPGKIWSRLTCLVFLIPVKIERRGKLDKATSYVFLANHQGAFDIFLIYGFLGRNFKWMMKQSLRNLPFVGKACKAAGHIFVDKSGPRKIVETITHARQVLQKGTSLVIFPEGRRSYTGKMGSFKKGAFQIADQLQLPVVPLTIEGSFNILPRTGKLLHWHTLKLIIHEPIYPQGKGAANQDMLMEESYRIIDSGLSAEYQNPQKDPQP